MKRYIFISFVFWLALWHPVIAQPEQPAGHQTDRAKQALDRVFDSEQGATLKKHPSLVILYRRITTSRYIVDLIYLAVDRSTIYSFHIWEEKAEMQKAKMQKAKMQWKAKLLPKTEEEAFPPSGPLGNYLERQGLRISNSARIGKQGFKGSVLQDIDNPTPLDVYRRAPDGKLLLVEADVK